MAYQFHHAAVGGTFDHLHIGHKTLLHKAFSCARLVSLGITSDIMLYDKQFSDGLEPYAVRRRQVTAYLKEMNWFHRARFHTLMDIYGITDREKTLDALVVTEEVMKNAQAINEKREKNGLIPLQIITVPLVKGPDGNIITSTHIRKGEINRQGYSYVSLFEGKDRYFITDELRQELKKPMGRVYKNKTLKVKNEQLDCGGRDTDHCSVHFTVRRGVFFPVYHTMPYQSQPWHIPCPQHGTSYYIEKRSFIAAEKNNYCSVFPNFFPSHSGIIIAVGDVVTMQLRQQGRGADIEIVDFKTRRRKISQAQIQTYLEDAHALQNDPGSLYCNTVMKLFEKIDTFLATGERQQLVIKGEEDLLTIPAILLSPLGSTVVYGQMDEGMVVVAVTEQMKEAVKGVLSRFRYGVEL